MIEIDGSEVSRWAAKANDAELVPLIGSEYSDADDIWIVEAVGVDGLTLVCDDNTGRRQKRPFDFFSRGSFFFQSECSGKSVQDLIVGSRSKSDKAIHDARIAVERSGFLISELGGDTYVKRLATAIRNFEEHDQIPDGDDWAEIHQILSQGQKQSVMRAGAKFVESMLTRAEAALNGRFDVFRRVSLAFLCRHTNQLDKALAVSDVVVQQGANLVGGNRSIAVLCTTRAAALLDVAEREQDRNRKAELIHKARLAANRANAIGEGDSDEVMLVYMRIKKLERVDQH